MPIVLDRETGAVISAPVYTPEQRRKAWAVIIGSMGPAALRQLEKEREKEGVQNGRTL